MFNWYDTIRSYYSLGLYTAAQLMVFVNAGWITQAQMDTIVSEQL